MHQTPPPPAGGGWGEGASATSPNSQAEGPNCIELLPRQRQQPVTRKTYGQQQQRAEQHQAPLAIAAQRLNQELQPERADHRCDNTFGAADHRHGDDQPHLIDRTDVRRQDADVVAIETTSETRETRRDCKGKDAEPHHLDACRRRRVLILADRTKEQAPARHHQEKHDPQRGDQQYQSQIIVRRVGAAAEQRRHFEAAGATRDLILRHDHDAQHFGECDGEQREIGTAHAQADEAYATAHDGAHQHTGDHAEWNRHAERHHQQTRRIGAQ